MKIAIQQIGLKYGYWGLKHVAWIYKRRIRSKPEVLHQVSGGYTDPHKLDHPFRPFELELQKPWSIPIYWLLHFFCQSSPEKITIDKEQRFHRLISPVLESITFSSRIAFTSSTFKTTPPRPNSKAYKSRNM